MEILQQQIQLYPKRWLVISCIGLENIIYAASLSYFGTSNNIFADYFNVTYAIVDWFNIINKPADWFVCACLALLTILNKNGFRKISIVTAACSLAGTLCNIMAFTWHSLYFLLYLGNFLIGILGGVLLVVPISFVILWFPDNEIGSAISVNMATANLGKVIAILIPSHILTPLTCEEIIDNFNATQNETYAKCKHSWQRTIKRNMEIYQGAITVLAAAALIVLIILAEDQPPKPPTIAQARIRQNKITFNSFTEQMRFFFSEIKLLFTDTTFINLVALFSFVNSAILFQSLYISEIMRPVFRLWSNPDVISSYLVILFQAGGVAGSILSGQLMNNFKRYVLLLRFGFCMILVSSIAFTFGYYFNNIPCTFIFNFFLGLCINFVLGPLYEISTTYLPPSVRFCNIMPNLRFCALQSSFIGTFSGYFKQFWFLKFISSLFSMLFCWTTAKLHFYSQIPQIGKRVAIEN